MPFIEPANCAPHLTSHLHRPYSPSLPTLPNRLRIAICTRQPPPTLKISHHLHHFPIVFHMRHTNINTSPTSITTCVCNNVHRTINSSLVNVQHVPRQPTQPIQAPGSLKVWNSKVQPQTPIIPYFNYTSPKYKLPLSARTYSHFRL